MCLGSPVTAAPGEGLRAGMLKLSPGIGFSATFDSNVFYSSDRQGPISAPSMTIRPFFTVTTEEPDMVDLFFRASVGWQQYIPLDEQVVLSRQSGLSTDLHGGFTLNPNGAVSLKLEDQLQRTNETPAGPQTFAINRLMNRLGVGLGLHPGGRVFQHYLNYNWLVYRHIQIPDIDRMVHNFQLKNFWRFFPRTAFVLDVDWSLIRYDVPFRDGVPLPNHNSSPLRISGGISGLVTNRINLQIRGGYGWAFYVDGPTHRGALIRTQLSYQLVPTDADSRLFAGYEYGFSDTQIASYFTYHRPFVGYGHGLMNRRLTLSLMADASMRNYVGIPEGLFASGTGIINYPNQLGDVLIRGSAGATFRIQRWWSVGAEYALQMNITEDHVTSNIPGDESGLRDYVRHVFMFQTRVVY